ncbi:phosphoribosylanthranilate isomerase [Salinarimonas ramus]|uniref:N-(5'-phosphoribosyl)anthranilate isomerase n=1 Tax=Salinarimonas ramus TaxID=690164 RepID=A0A917QI38_9HYPH|nr:phosphoribosylanthranilate isomerase [Salinarimonas ramus]GGK52326.1 N-(5'-phosphoribosyl)anthranilate isomerase [Salinarimonas ramus]
MKTPGLVKICGLKTPSTLDAALAAGADMVGLVHFPRSPRHIDLAEAGLLAERARGRASVVALLVDPDDDLLDALVASVRPDLLQLHGKETPERVGAVKARFGVPVMKAIGIAEEADLARVPPYAAVCDRLLFDAKPPKPAADGATVLPGGNGIAFDWRLVAALDPGRPAMLSGGLTAETVGTAIALTGMRAVDVSSGVETAPGLKDPIEIVAFVAAARAAWRAQDEAGTP